MGIYHYMSLFYQTTRIKCLYNCENVENSSETESQRAQKKSWGSETGEEK